jgi:hypothetical protein
VSFTAYSETKTPDEIVQMRISQGIPPALAQATVDRKKSSVPLVDTGQLRSAITWQVG